MCTRGGVWFINLLHEGLDLANLGPVCMHTVQPRKGRLSSAARAFFVLLSFTLFIVPVSHLCQY